MRISFINVAIVCTALASCVLALEFGLRYYDGVSFSEFENFVEKRVSLVRVQTLSEYHDTLGWITRSNLAQSGTNHHGDVITFTIGDHGVRMNSDQIRTLPTGAVLAVGDSFTAGSEVSDHESWPAYLERALNEPVVNAAVGAWGSDQIVLHAEHMSELLRPRLVIISFLWHDILRADYDIYIGAHKPYFTIEENELVHRNYPVPIFDGKATEIGWKRASLGYSYLVTWMMQRIDYQQWFVPWDAQYRKVHPDGTGIDISCRLLERFKKRADRENFRLVFLMQYGSTDFVQDSPPAQAAAVSECAVDDSDIDVIDPWIVMKVIHDSDLPRFHDLWVLQADNKTYGHMSRVGNELMAQELLRVIR